jgi:hypothetical protein
MTIALIKGTVTTDGVVTLAFAPNYQSPTAISMGANNVITINEVNQLSLDFSGSSGNFGSNEIKIYTVTGGILQHPSIGTICSPDYKCTIDAVTENLDFHFGLPSSTPEGLIGDPIDSTGEIIVR